MIEKETEKERVRERGKRKRGGRGRSRKILYKQLDAGSRADLSNEHNASIPTYLSAEFAV